MNKRKTKDVFVLYGDYGYGPTYILDEDTWSEIQKQYHIYRENEPQVKHTIVHKRVPLTSDESVR